ncbi:MAG: DNA-protecting protein DprA [Nitrospirae bacterium]|nr:MAG: DNA-protecting protein DprA [Nitrospirota bacterium]
MTSETLYDWLVLRTIRGLNERMLLRAVQHFDGPHGVRHASVRELEALGMKRAVAEAVAMGPDPETEIRIRRTMQRMAECRVEVVSIVDPGYPARLAMIADPPLLLYYTGPFFPRTDQAVAIVGTRRASHAGCALTEELSYNLATLGLTIVSGLARGIDAAAHRGALKANGRTEAVLGCGLDRTYPPEHRQLRQQIEGNGAVLSEWPVGEPPRPYHFPRRNRVISGLSLGVVVTEASRASGALITARFAVEQNREVFAVPGSIKDNRHQGAHWLIQQGAKLVEGPDDVLEELRPQLDLPQDDQVNTQRGAQTETMLSREERDIYAMVSDDPISVDDILAQAPFFPAEVMSILLALELKGLIRQVPGAAYVRT